MRRIKNVLTVGNSLAITIEKADVKKLNINPGDQLEVDFIGKVE